MEEDKRFTHIQTDPKFRRIPKSQRKVKIDKRFQSMFSDNKFKVKYTIDKRGRPISHSTSEDLKRYYELSSSEEEEEENEDKDEEEESKSSSDSEQIAENEKEEPNLKQKELKLKKLKKKPTKVNLKYKKPAENEENLEKNTNEKNEIGQEALSTISSKTIPEKVKKRLKNLKVDYARGEGILLSDSSSDDDSEEESEEETKQDDKFDHKWGELDADAERTDEITARLAACNMDWDRIKAVDLMVLFNSFVPSTGLIKSVTIYPSEFGKQRMAEEEVKGPSELIEDNLENDSERNEEENADGSKYHMEKLRKYQLNRLKYYYAVVVCDSASTANKIYSECDGMEYESSATKIDLRFIPDDVSFDEDEPKEICDQMPETNKYKPRFFTTTALQQAKVDLTWDETNPERLEVAQKLASGNMDDIAGVDLQNYLASSSESEDEDEEDAEGVENGETGEKESNNANPIDKYKLLLQEIENKEKDKQSKEIGMEISWGIDLQQKTDSIMKQKKESSETKTPFEEYLDKRKAKRKEKREGKHNKKEEENADVPSDIDMNDPYFAEEFNKPEFKQTSTKNKKNKKQEKYLDSSESSEDEEEKAKRQQQLELLLNDNDDVDGENGKKHFSLKKIQEQESDSKSKRKRKKKEVAEEKTKIDDFEINVDDDRFSALYSSHHYNIDPTDPHFKKTKNMDKLISEKIKRRVVNDSSSKLSKKPKEESKKKINAELSVLVKSVKRKTETFRNKKSK